VLVGDDRRFNEVAIERGTRRRSRSAGTTSRLHIGPISTAVGRIRSVHSTG